MEKPLRPESRSRGNLANCRENSASLALCGRTKDRGIQITKKVSLRRDLVGFANEAENQTDCKETEGNVGVGWWGGGAEAVVHSGGELVRRKGGE